MPRPWAAAGPGRATGGRPMLRTSSNRSNLKPLARPAVTNVVNPHPKTAIFSEKAVGLTTFVTTNQKSTRKTPPIDDVCNNTQEIGQKSQHSRPLRCPRAAPQRPGTTGVEGPEGLEGQAAEPTGSNDTTASQISHVIYRGHFSTHPKNVAIPMMQIQCLNKPQGNYVRN